METRNINIIPGGTTAVIHVSQNDVGRTIEFNVQDRTEWFDLTGATVKIQGTKPSGLGYSLTGTVSGHTATFVTDMQMTDEHGSIASELKITRGDMVIGSANFILAVERDPHPENTTDGSADSLVPAITLLVERVEAAVAKEEVLHEAEAWAVGQRAGEDVDEEDDTYHNNAKYYAGIAEGAKTSAGASEQNAAASASAASGSASSAAASNTAAQKAKEDAEAAAAAAASTFSVVGNVAFTVLENGQVREIWTEEE